MAHKMYVCSIKELQNYCILEGFKYNKVNEKFEGNYQRLIVKRDNWNYVRDTLYKRCYEGINKDVKAKQFPSPFVVKFNLKKGVGAVLENE